MSADLWGRIWLLCMAYPALAFMVLVMLCVAGTLVALAIVSMTRPALPLDQWQDDKDQVDAVSGRMPLDGWQRAGGNWRGDL